MKISKIIVLFVISILSACSTLKTESLVDRFQSVDEVMTVIGEPSYKIDNRYVWVNNREVPKKNVTSIDYLEQYIHSKNFSLSRKCYLTIVSNPQQKIIFREAEGNTCDTVYGTNLQNYLMSEERLSRGYHYLAVFGNTLLTILAAYGEAGQNMDLDMSSLKNIPKIDMNIDMEIPSQRVIMPSMPISP